MRGILSDQLSAESILKRSNINVAAQSIIEEAKVETSNVEPMVPEREFENLKSLTFQIEKEATETIEKKDGHIRSLLEEI